MSGSVDLTAAQELDDEIIFISSTRKTTKRTRPIPCSDDVIFISSTPPSFLPPPRHTPKKQKLNPHTKTAALLISQNQKAAALALSLNPPAPTAEPSLKCSICLCAPSEMSATTCGHIFCTSCIEESLKSQKNCPNCRKKLGKKGVFPLFTWIYISCRVLYAHFPNKVTYKR